MARNSLLLLRWKLSSSGGGFDDVISRSAQNHNISLEYSCKSFGFWGLLSIGLSFSYLLVWFWADRICLGTCSNNDYLSRNGSGGLGSSSALDNEAQALRRKRLAAAEVATTPSSSTDSGRSERGRTVIGETTRSSASQGQIHNSFSIPNFWNNEN